jgi:hypothetical protein
VGDLFPEMGRVNSREDMFSCALLVCAALDILFMMVYSAEAKRPICVGGSLACLGG